MRTFRIRSTVAAIAAAIPLSIGLNAQAQDQNSTSRSSTTTSQPSAYTTQPSAQHELAGQAMAQDGRKLVGKDLYGAQGEQIGEISNVLAKDGKASAVVVDVGGFLGMGEKTVAIPLDNLQVGEDRVTATNLTEESAKNLPEYDERNPGDYSPLVSRDGQSAWERDSARDGATTSASQPAANTSAAQTNPK